MPNGDNVYLIPHFGTDGYVLTWRNGGWNWEAAGSGSGDITKDELAGGTPITSLSAGEYFAISKPGTPNEIKIIEKDDYIAWIEGILDLVYAGISHTHEGYVSTSTTVNSKALSSNITLNQDDIGDGTTYKQYSTTEKSKLSGIEASADVTDITNISSSINGASAATPVDADKFVFVDDTDATIKTVTGANLKSYIGVGSGDVTKDELAGATTVTTIASTEYVPITVPGSPNVIKKITMANLQIQLDDHDKPIGTVLMYNSTSIDPNTLFHGTWARLEGVGWAGMYDSDSTIGMDAVGAVSGGAMTKDVSHSHTTPALSHATDDTSTVWVATHGAAGFNVSGGAINLVTSGGHTSHKHAVTPTQHSANNTGTAGSSTQDVKNSGYVLCFWQRTA